MRFSLSCRDVEELLADEPYAGRRVETLSAAVIFRPLTFYSVSARSFHSGKEVAVSNEQLLITNFKD